MTIVVTGGGSGGHITPILAVAAELKQLRPDAHIVYIGQKGDGLGDIPAADPNIDEVYAVRAGKFRRYHGEGLKQLLDIKTLVLNVRDAFYVLAGIWQSRRLLKRLHPEVIFIKGGFVGVPVGIAASRLHIPFVTHDSDAIPGLANRIIGRWAALHAVAMPKEIYPYAADKTVTTGIPLQAGFRPVTAAMQAQYKEELGLKIDDKLLFIIGGGLGAHRVNMAVAEIVPELLQQIPNLQVVHGVGRANEAAMQKLYMTSLSTAEQSRVVVKGYLSDVYRYSGASDVIITRAGATNLAEFAQQGKACIVVPNPLLTGGHQIKNAVYLQEQEACVVVSEADLQADPGRLGGEVQRLLEDQSLREQLGKNFAKFAQPDAAHHLSMLLLEQAKA